MKFQDSTKSPSLVKMYELYGFELQNPVVAVHPNPLPNGDVFAFNSSRHSARHNYLKLSKLREDMRLLQVHELASMKGACFVLKNVLDSSRKHAEALENYSKAARELRDAMVAEKNANEKREQIEKDILNIGEIENSLSVSLNKA
jgi:hypothetical protein